MYFLFDVNPSLSISDLIALLMSKKISPYSKISKKIFKINKYWRFCWFNSIELLSMNVKKVKKPTKRVMRNIKIMNIFFFKNSCIF